VGAAVTVAVLATGAAGTAGTSGAAAPAASSLQRAESWDWPLDGERRVLRPFVAPPHPYGAGHRGVDLAASGDTVRAPADGVVTFAGVVVDRPVLTITHADGLRSSFEPVTSDLVAGDRVRRGDAVGTVLAGHCARVCLHLGARIGDEYVSPLALLGLLDHTVLLGTRR
jgi:murein DD-endopeptidase MepM/ murein hydrolase activator NlpD